jgi:hypothetical protein
VSARIGIAREDTPPKLARGAARCQSLPDALSALGKALATTYRLCRLPRCRPRIVGQHLSRALLHGGHNRRRDLGQSPADVVTLHGRPLRLGRLPENDRVALSAQRIDDRCVLVLR